MAIQTLQNLDTYGNIRNQINSNFTELSNGLNTANQGLQTANQGLQTANQELQTTKQSLQTTQNELDAAELKLQTAEQDIDKLQEDMANVNKYEKYVVVAIAGQSNAVGYDESIVANNLSYKNYNNNRIKQLGFYGGNNLKLIDLGYCAESMQDMRQQNGKKEAVRRGTKGLHLPLANLMLDYIPDDYGVLVLPIAFGGTGFNSGNNGTYNADLKKPTDTSSTAGEGTVALKWGKDTAYYQTLRDRIKHALELNEGNMFAGIIWCQGENDMGNAANHYTKFQEMTTALFDELNAYNSGALKNRTPKGTWDKDIWYNMETVAYWYGQGECSIIWENYKTWNTNTYIEIPRNTDSNLINGTGDTASVKEKHYGNNAYQKVIAPLVLQKMIDMNTFSKKIAVVNNTKEEEKEPVEDVVVNVTFENTNTVLTDADVKKSTASTDFTFTIVDGNCTVSHDIVKNMFNTHKPYLDFGDITKLEWTAKRGAYWVVIEGESVANCVVIGLGDRWSHHVAKFVNGTLSVIEQGENVYPNDRYDLKENDKLKVYREHDGKVVVYRTDNGNGIYQKWFEVAPQNLFKQSLGLTCGISDAESFAPFDTDLKSYFSNMTIQKEEYAVGSIEFEKTVDLLNGKIRTLENKAGTVNCTGATTGSNQVIPIVKVGSSTNALVFQNGTAMAATKKYLPANATPGILAAYSDSAGGNNNTAWWTVDFSHSGQVSYILV